jgi:hypothetical protein
MLRNGYLTKAEASRLRTAYTKYIANLNAMPQDQHTSQAIPQKTITEKTNQLKIHQNKTVSVQKPPKKKLTKEQLREKNLTLVLILGVSFLLLGGFILATTNWGAMNAFIKMLAILSVSIVFSLMSYVARKLHIRQTAFAFTTLSALFLPIVIVCASYYQLLGSYFALHGYGATLLGCFSSLLFVLLYHWIARRYSSRLFEGLSLLFGYSALCFGAYFLTHQMTAWQVAINLFSLIWLAASHFWTRARQSRIFDYTLKYERIFMQSLVAANALLALIFWQPMITYSIVSVLVSCAFLWCAYRGMSKVYHAGYLFFCAQAFYQVTLYAHSYSVSIASWTVLLAFYIAISEYGIQRFADPVWARVYRHLSASSACIFSIGIPLYTYSEVISVPNRAAYLWSLLALVGIIAILVILTRRHQEKWFPYATLLAVYALVFDVCIILQSSLATELRSLMLLSFLLFINLFLYKHAARFIECYQTALPIVTGGILFLSLAAGYSIFDTWEWLIWATAAWILLLLTSLLRSGTVAKFAGHANAAWLGIALIVLFPNTWAESAQLAAASAVLLAYYLIARAYTPAFRRTVLYTSGVYYVIGLLFIFNELEPAPTVSALAVLIFGALLSAVFLKHGPSKLWALPHGLLSGAALLYPTWLLASHGVALTWIVLYLEAVAFGTAAASCLFLKKKDPIPGTIYYWMTHTLMLLSAALIWNSFFDIPVLPLVSVLPAASYMYYCYKTRSKIARLVSFCGSALLVLGLLENLRRYFLISGISFWQCVSVTAVLLFLFYLKANGSWRKTAFYPTLIFLGLAVPTAFLDPFYWMIIPLAGFAWFTWTAVKLLHQYVFSTIVFLLIFLWGLRIQEMLHLTETSVYAFALTALAAILCWLFSKEPWRKVMHPAVFILLSLTALTAVSTVWDPLGIFVTLIGISASLVLLIFLYVYQYRDLSFLPMLFLSVLLWINLGEAPFMIKTASFLTSSLALLALSLSARAPLFEHNKKRLSFSFNYELITAFIYLFAFYGYMDAHAIYFGKLGAACLVTVYCGLAAYRSVHSLERKLWMNSALVTFLWPIALALQKSPLLPFIHHVLFSAALLAVISISCRKLWSINRNIMMLEWIAVGLIYLRLMLLALMIGETGTLLTFAIVALIGTIAGFLLKYKSYFFSSIGALIISLLYNRRHIWIELPWWFYLVIGGFTLIAIASVAEWTRQDKLRRAKLSLPPRESLVQKIKHYLSAWR